MRVAPHIAPHYAVSSRLWCIAPLQAEAEGANLVFSELDDSEDEEDFMKAPAIRVSSNGETVSQRTADLCVHLLSALEA